MDQSTNTANAIVATTITVWGIATGLSYEVLLAGFAGGLVSLSYLPAMGMWRRLWTLLTSTLTAGYSAPLAVVYLTKMVAAEASPLAVLIFCSFALGVGAQILIPAALAMARRKLEDLEPRA